MSWIRYLIGTWQIRVAVILIYDYWIWYIFHQHVLEGNISGRATAPDGRRKQEHRLAKLVCGRHNVYRNWAWTSTFYFTCHVLILAPFSVFDKTAPSTLMLRTCADVCCFPKLPILINKRAIDPHQLLWSDQSNSTIEHLRYLIPWPGPQAMSLIEILEELPTIETQSSPGKRVHLH